MKFNKIKTENYLYEYFRKRKLPNLSVGIILKEEQFFFNYGFENAISSTGESALYEIGSVTKLFVAAVYASLITKKKIQLQDNLHSLLGDHFDIAPQFRNITIHSLLTHSSGLPRLPEEFLVLIEDIDNPYKNLDDTVITEYLKLSEENIGKRKYQYSNLGYGILGFILTVKFKKDLFSIIKEIILEPLGMSETTVLPFAAPEFLLPGHNAANAIVPHWEMHSFQGAGFLISNTADMVKFLRAQLDPCNSIFPFLKLTQQFDNNDRVALGWHKYGLLGRILRWNKYIWHNGMTGGFSSYIAINPSAGIGAVALTNKTDDLDECMFGLYVKIGIT
jgi:CubicO group peptidase (beta-lactamase class C family)